MNGLVFKSGVGLLGSSLLGCVLDFLILSDDSTMSRVLIWYVALGGTGAVLIFLGRNAGSRSL